MVPRPSSPGLDSASPEPVEPGSSDERYRTLFALSPQPAWVYDTRTLAFLEVNDAAVSAYGWSRPEFLEMSLRDIRPPAELARLDQQLDDTPTRGGYLHASVHRTKSGIPRRVEISSFPIGFDGHDARMVLVHDVTDTLEAVEALVESEKQYRSLVEQLVDVFFRTNEQGLWSFLNPAWTVLTGHSVAESIGTHYLSYVHPSDRGALLDAVSTLGERGHDSTVVEVRYFRRDGGYRWVEASMHSTRDDAGNMIGSSGVLRDVTDRRAAREERQRLATNIRQLLDASGEGIYGLDSDGHVTFINRRGSELLGYLPEELVGRSMHAAVHYSRADGTSYPIEESPIQRTAKLGEPCDIDDEVMWRKDGIALRVEYAASPVMERGRISGAVVNFRDITARKLAELELIEARDAAEAASRAKSEFLARMSHELRTPLNSIIGFSNVLRKNRLNALSGIDLTYLDRIATNGRHLLGLINDILDLSKIEAGHMTLEIGAVYMDTLVRETIDELEGQLGERTVPLRVELPDLVLPIASDEARMRQVLVNLIGNALKFTEQGEVVVRLDTDDTGYPTTLQVRDTGIGIPADRLDAIFNVFEQAESMITRRFGGTGLGLAISRSLSELMGHRLDAESVEGVGTTMSITFDAHQRTSSGAVTNAAAPASDEEAAPLSRPVPDVLR